MKKHIGFMPVLMAVISIALAIMMLPGAALAHPVGEDAIATPKGEIKAGITPDSPFHFFENMFDNMGMSLTSSPEKRAERGLEIARERLMEAKEMIELGNPGAARIAEQEHANALAAVEDSVKKLSGSSELELEKEIEFEFELEEHQNEIETVKVMVKAKLSSASDSSRMAEAESMLLTIRARADNARSEVKLEKENSAQRLKQQTGKSENEIEFEVRKLEDSTRRSRGGRVEVGLDGSGGLEERSRVRAFVAGDSAQARVELRFPAQTSDMKSALNELLSRLKMSSSEVITILDVGDKRENLKDRIRVDIDVKNGVTVVKFRADFPVSATSREAISKAIADRLAAITSDDLEESLRVGAKDDDELRGSAFEAGEDIRGNADENEVRGREAENELRGRDNELGEDVRGNADENEVRGRDNEPGEDVRGNADENEIRGQEAEARGREAEGEAPRGADSPSDFDSTPGSRGGGGSGSS